MLSLNLLLECFVPNKTVILCTIIYYNWGRRIVTAVFVVYHGKQMTRM